MLFRLQLGLPNADLEWLKPLLGDWITPEHKLSQEFYLALVTMHGTIMVFFVLTAGLSGTFSNFLIPLQIGARDMASGFLNMLSYWFFFVSRCDHVHFSVFRDWSCKWGVGYLSSFECGTEAILLVQDWVTLWLCAMALFIISSLLGGINYITTIINLRTKG